MKPFLYMYITFLFLVSFHISTTQSIIALKPAHIVKPSNSIKQFLYAHNTVRARYRLPPLRWSSRLARYAKWYANQRRKDCALIHSSAHIYGENIFWGQGRKWKPSDAVGAWASEESYYIYKTNSCLGGKDCWHFTQLVWRNSKEVGCAMLKCLSGDTFIVCEYNPHGNIIGKWPY